MQDIKAQNITGHCHIDAKSAHITKKNIPINFSTFKIKLNVIDILSIEINKNLELICIGIINGDKLY